jgi:putative ABC transport system substrate-binding protein
MRRREFAFGLAAILAPRLGHAQQPERMRRIGYLTPATGSPDNAWGVALTRAFVGGLSEFGWFDGRNVSVDHRFSGGGRERIRINAKELVASAPDAILSIGGPPLAALLAETQTLPIVFVLVGDPIGSGFVSNLAHPGGNATGFSISASAEIAGKQLQLLKKIAPNIVRVLVLSEADNPPQRVDAEAMAAAAPLLGVRLQTVAVREIGDYERAIDDFAPGPAGGLAVLPNVIANDNQETINALAAHHHLPAVYTYPIFARTGGLISYGSDPLVQLRDAAGYIAKILRGEKPGDLPVQQPTRFVLAVNLKTAKALGLTVPQTILARADEVIE